MRSRPVIFLLFPKRFSPGFVTLISTIKSPGWQIPELLNPVSTKQMMENIGDRLMKSEIVVKARWIPDNKMVDPELSFEAVNSLELMEHKKKKKVII
jgi:hypothetical protein